MKEKINNIEFSSTLFLILFSCTLCIAPYITIKIAGIDYNRKYNWSNTSLYIYIYL